MDDNNNNPFQMLFDMLPAWFKAIWFFMLGASITLTLIMIWGLIILIHAI